MQIDRPIVSAIIIFIVILLVFFLVMPEYKAFVFLRDDLAKKRAEYDAERDYYAAIYKTYSELQVRQEDIKKIDNALPTDPDLGKIVYFLQRAAAQNSIIIKDLFLSRSAPANLPKTGGQPGTNAVKDITFSMDVLGDYISLQQFIITLEKSARVLEVASITFGSSEEMPQENQTQFQLQQTYNVNLQVRTHSY
jgi:Tfp pilus assembly protein PilO